MIDAKGQAPAAFAAGEFSLRIHEPLDVAASEPTCRETRSLPSSRIPLAGRADFPMRRLASEVLAAVQSRLPGRIRDLQVRIEGDVVVLTGVSSSYYVKQVAQHIAMTTIDEVMLCHLVNEIEVCTPR